MHEIILKGSPRRRGLEHGKALAEEVRFACDTICKPLREDWGKEKDGVLHKLLKTLEESFPDLVEEIRGISDGSGLDFEEVFLLNSYHGLGAIDFQCTNLAFGNSEDGAIHGKTGDAEASAAPYYLVETVYPDEGPSFVTTCYVGTVWTESGLNSIGLSCGQSSSSIITGQDGRGIPTLIMPRPLLQHCSNVEEGIELLSKYDMAGKGLNIFLADSHGGMAVVEKSYDKQAVRRPGNGALWNTNFFQTDEMAKYNYTRGEDGIRNSCERDAYLQQILVEKEVPRTVEEMKKILASHETPGTICRHNAGEKKTCTHFGAVFIPREKRALITHGNPCENEFKEYRL